MTGSDWRPARETASLQRDAVDVWRSSLEAGEGGEAALLCLLSPGERARAASYAFEQPRRRWIASRGLLRDLLARITGADAADLVLVEDEKGKPRLADAAAHGGLRFNLSHSGDLWVCAVTVDREVGIDVEYVERGRPFRRLSRRYFSAAEREALDALPDDDVPQGFYRCWTRKEALLKAMGFGVTIPLDSFDVTLAPGDPPAVVATRFDPLEAERWSILDMDAAPDHAGALCVEGEEPEVRLWDLGR